MYSEIMHWFNRNAVGTHFGGSLYSMVDPHLMLMLIQLLGEEYWVWDKSAEIEFVKATNKTVTSVIKIANEDLEEIKRQTADREKYLPEFVIEIIDDDSDVVAIVRKTIYVRRKNLSE